MWIAATYVFAVCEMTPCRFVENQPHMLDCVILWGFLDTTAALQHIRPKKEAVMFQSPWISAHVVNQRPAFQSCLLLLLWGRCTIPSLVRDLGPFCPLTPETNGLNKLFSGMMNDIGFRYQMYFSTCFWSDYVELWTRPVKIWSSYIHIWVAHMQTQWARFALLIVRDQ